MGQQRNVAADKSATTLCKSSKLSRSKKSNIILLFFNKIQPQKVLYQDLTSNFKRLNLIFLGFVCAVDIGIAFNYLPRNIALPFFIGSIGFCVFIAFVWVAIAIKNLLIQKKGTETRGLIFLLQFFKWMSMAFLVFLIHSFLMWTTPINT